MRDEIKIRQRGLFSEYRPDSTHQDVIYFATDTQQILLNGKDYGSSSKIPDINVVEADTGWAPKEQRDIDTLTLLKPGDLVFINRENQSGLLAIVILPFTESMALQVLSYSNVEQDIDLIPISGYITVNSSYIFQIIITPVSQYTFDSPLIAQKDSTTNNVNVSISLADGNPGISQENFTTDLRNQLEELLNLSPDIQDKLSNLDWYEG